MPSTVKSALAALVLIVPSIPGHAQSPAALAAFDELLKCRDRYPETEGTLFWRCAKDVLTQSKIDRRRVSDAIAAGDYAVSIYLQGRIRDKELNKQLADILAKATD